MVSRKISIFNLYCVPLVQKVMCTEADGASVSGFLALTCLWKAPGIVCEKIKNNIADVGVTVPLAV